MHSVSVCMPYAFMSSNCSHEVAVTALHITDAMCVAGKISFDETYLETLLEKVIAVSRASHRPCKTVGGAHIQPQMIQWKTRMRRAMRRRRMARRPAMNAVMMRISQTYERDVLWPWL